ncbi:hypothetical protein ACS0TY_002217 [Phlomoides rotata]
MAFVVTGIMSTLLIYGVLQECQLMVTTRQIEEGNHKTYCSFIEEGRYYCAYNEVHSDKSFDLDNPKDMQWVYSKGIMNQLCDVITVGSLEGTAQDLNPDFKEVESGLRLVIRTVGSLEGTAQDLNPDFKEVESAYSFVIGRLLMDPSPDMRKILGQLLIRNDGTTRWNQLEKLVGVFLSIDDLFSRLTGSSRLIHSLPQAIMAFLLLILA